MMLLFLAVLIVPLQIDRTVLEKTAAPSDITIDREPVAEGLRLTLHAKSGTVDPPSITLVPNGEIAIEIRRQATAFPYVLKHSAATGRIEWFAHYRAEGILHISPCQTRIIATDTNGDGVFDTINPGKSFQLCGHQVTLESIAPDGTSATFEASRILPRIGDPVPEFTLTTTSGETIDSKTFRGKRTLLDFWATWCNTCMREMPELPKLNVNLISINIDPPDHQPKTLPPWPQVRSGIGIADPTWQIFQSLSSEGSLPLYVLIDENGIIRKATPDLKSLQ